MTLLLGEPGPLLDVLSGLPLLALALWLARLRPARAGVRALALLSAGLGVIVVVLNVATLDDPLAPWFQAVAIGGFVLLVLGYAAMLRHFPRPLGPADRGRLRLALALAGSTTAATLLLLPFAAVPVFVVQGITPLTNALLWATQPLGILSGVLLLAYVLFLPLRAADPRTAGPEVRQDAVVFGAVTLLVGYNQGYWVFAPDALTWYGAAAWIVLNVGAAALWLRAGALRAGRDAALCRLAALLALALPLAGMAGTVLLGGFDRAAYGPFGAARILGVLVLAWAILRQDLLGLDVKVRWTIRQSTVAAAFVGVFFVGSEGAQLFFGDAAGSEWLGIAAAGLLVFAIAPLQRAAERVASAAVPGDAPWQGRPSLREEQYRTALRVALRDGHVTDGEAQQLAGLADSLGLGAAAYERIRREVEREMAAERRPPASAPAHEPARRAGAGARGTRSPGGR